MIKIKLKYVTIIDLVLSLILCGMSFSSGFPIQLITIFLSGFLIRFVFNFIIAEKYEKVKSK